MNKIKVVLTKMIILTVFLFDLAVCAVESPTIADPGTEVVDLAAVRKEYICDIQIKSLVTLIKTLDSEGVAYVYLDILKEFCKLAKQEFESWDMLGMVVAIKEKNVDKLAKFEKFFESVKSDYDLSRDMFFVEKICLFNLDGQIPGIRQKIKALSSASSKQLGLRLEEWADYVQKSNDTVEVLAEKGTKILTEDCDNLYLEISRIIFSNFEKINEAENFIVKLQKGLQG